MDELTGLIDANGYTICTTLYTEIPCPSSNVKVFTVSCNDCIYCKDNSINHTRLKELIPILLID